MIWERLTAIAPLVGDRVIPFEGTRPFVATGGMDDAGGLNPVLVTYADRPARADLRVGSGDVCFARMQATVKVRQFTEVDGDVILSTGFAVLRPDPGRLEPRYLRHYLRSPIFQMAKDGLCTGATQRAITNGKIQELRVPLPPIEEQRRIAAILDQADELRAKRRASLALLDSVTESIFLDMFGDPVANPMGWPLRKFVEVCPTRLGKMLDQKHQTGLHRRPYLRNANVRWFGFDLTDLAEMDFSDADRVEFKVEPGDLLICEGGEPGRAAVWDGSVVDIYFQKALHRGRPDRSQITATYLAHLLWHLAEGGGLSDHISSATIAHLTGERLKAMMIPVPDLEVQRRFESVLSAIEGVRDSALHADREIDALLSSLQHRAFAGQL